jgi:UDP-sulfoquinovose synthase
MKVIVLGGDGFVGWPISLRLSNEGHMVTIIDNFARRNADQELGCASLTPICFMSERVKKWKEVTGKKILFKRVDVAKNYYGLLDVIKKLKPDVIIHLAEQRAAPYSMKSEYHKRYTVSNNICATHNILCAIVESGIDIHLVHIGSTGVYGYHSSNIPIPEGYLDFSVEIEDVLYDMRDYYPMSPGSVYHATKCMDAMLFRFYAKNDGLRITDLHQGIIWGVETDETIVDKFLINRFDYCGDYGTVLNRFLMQGATGNPLTVYGSGKQTRAFIHIVNSCDCVSLAIKNPPLRFDEVKIFNQTTEQLRLIDLSKIVADMTGGEIKYCPNPRVEPESNDLKLENKQFMDLGLEPIFVDSEYLEDICKIAHEYKDRINKEAIECKSYWRKDLCTITQNS